MLEGSAYEGAQGAVAIEFPPFNVGGSEGVAGVFRNLSREIQLRGGAVSHSRAGGGQQDGREHG